MASMSMGKLVAWRPLKMGKEARPWDCLLESSLNLYLML